MAHPQPYKPSTNFSQQDPVTPNPAALDVELLDIARVLNRVRNNARRIQRDDGELANESVTFDALDLAVAAAISGGWRPRGAWKSQTAYKPSDYVSFGDFTYVCVTAHTSGLSFIADQTAGRWMSAFTLRAIRTNLAEKRFEADGVSVVFQLDHVIQPNDNVIVFVESEISGDYVADVNTDLVVFDNPPPAPSVPGVENIIILHFRAFPPDIGGGGGFVEVQDEGETVSSQVATLNVKGPSVRAAETTVGAVDIEIEPVAVASEGVLISKSVRLMDFYGTGLLAQERENEPGVIDVFVAGGGGGVISGLTIYKAVNTDWRVDSPTILIRDAAPVAANLPAGVALRDQIQVEINGLPELEFDVATAGDDIAVTLRPTANVLDGDTVVARAYLPGLSAGGGGGGIRTFRQAAEPTTGSTGDLWFDTDDNNHPYMYIGGGWVSVLDGRFTSLQSTVNQLVDDVEGKADSSAINALSLRVDANEDKISAQSLFITGLDASVGAVIGTLQQKADSEIVSRLDARVVANENAIVAETLRVDTLRSDLDSIDTDITDQLNDKADASVVNSLNTRVGNAEGAISAQADSINTVSAQVGGLQGTVTQTRQAVATLEDDVARVQTTWGFELGVGNVITGIMAHNDGRTSDIIMTTDNFVIVGGSQVVKPFQVIGNRVTISNLLVDQIEARTIRAEKIRVGDVTFVELAPNTTFIRDSVRRSSGFANTWLTLSVGSFGSPIEVLIFLGGAAGVDAQTLDVEYRRTGEAWRRLDGFGYSASAIPRYQLTYTIQPGLGMIEVRIKTSRGGALQEIKTVERIR